MSYKALPEYVGKKAKVTRLELYNNKTYKLGEVFTIKNAWGWSTDTRILVSKKLNAQGIYLGIECKLIKSKVKVLW